MATKAGGPAGAIEPKLGLAVVTDAGFIMFFTSEETKIQRG